LKWGVFDVRSLIQSPSFSNKSSIPLLILQSFHMTHCHILNVYSSLYRPVKVSTTLMIYTLNKLFVICAADPVNSGRLCSLVSRINHPDGGFTCMWLRWVKFNFISIILGFITDVYDLTVFIMQTWDLIWCSLMMINIITNSTFIF
jgi:hypothetical protein